jgi:hypothetical protein
VRAGNKKTPSFHWGFPTFASKSDEVKNYFVLRAAFFVAFFLVAFLAALFFLAI